MIVVNGLNQAVYWLGGSAAIRPTYIGVGEGTTAPEYNDTALTNEIYPTTTRNSTTKTKTSDSIAYLMSEDTTEGSTTVYSEHGLFSNETTGTMWIKQTHPDLSKTDNVKVEDYITIEIGSYLP